MGKVHRDIMLCSDVEYNKGTVKDLRIEKRYKGNTSTLSLSKSQGWRIDDTSTSVDEPIGGW